MDIEQLERYKFLKRMEAARKHLNKSVLLGGPGIPELVQAHDRALANPEASLTSVHAEVEAELSHLDRTQQIAGHWYVDAVYTPQFEEDLSQPPKWWHYVKAAKPEVRREQELVRLEQSVAARTTEFTLETNVSLPTAAADQLINERVSQLVEQGWCSAEDGHSVLQVWKRTKADSSHSWHAVIGAVKEAQLEPVAAEYLTTVVDAHVGAGKALDWQECEQEILSQRQIAPSAPTVVSETHQGLSPQL